MKAVYIHSRFGPHPIHKKFAENIQAEFQLVDFILPWHGQNAWIGKRYMSWFLCALFFPDLKKYDLIVSDAQYVPPVLMKLLGRLRKDQKVVCLHDNETLFFLKAGRYSTYTTFLYKKIIRLYDFHICTSQLQSDILKCYLRVNQVYQIFNGVSKERMSRLNKINPDLKSKNILFIGNLYAGWRMWYKGLDLMLDAFAALASEIDEFRFIIIGAMEDKVKDHIFTNYPQVVTDKIDFVGKTNHIDKYLEQASLYLHIARGEAFGISVLEAMAAGVPAIISEWTGAKDVVSKVDNKMIVKAEVSSVIQSIEWYYNLSETDKLCLSHLSCEVAKDYTEENAVNIFRQAVITISKH